LLKQRFDQIQRAKRCAMRDYIVQPVKLSYDLTWGEHMAKLAIVATIKTVPGKRDEYLKHLKAHAQRCLATEPGTLKFEILMPKEEADTLMLYEVYASPEAFQAHWTGLSMQQAKQDAAGLQVSLSGVRCDLVE
jgi:quinol monooxygenase YgiN